jgi:hypothetical protein
MFDLILKKIFGKYTKEVLVLFKELELNERDELNIVTKEYVDKILKIAGLDLTDFDDELLDSFWSYVIGAYYGIKARKEDGDIGAAYGQ